MTRRDVLALVGALGLPVDAAAWWAAQDQPPAAAGSQPPDLGNLHELMAWISRENPPRLSFLDPGWTSVDDWKQVARPVFERFLGYAPAALPLTAEIQGREERDGLTIETLRIRATSAYDIPARLLFPTRAKRPLPGVVALHCHGGQFVWGLEKLVASRQDAPSLLDYRERLYGNAYAERLASRGYVVIAIDAFYFGSRRLRVEELDPATAPADLREGLEKLASARPESWPAAVSAACGRYETLVAKTIFSAGATWPGILTWDDRRSVDYLCSRPEVDARRIGCLGLSLGGLRAARLIGADPRIRAACVVGWMTEFRHQLRNHLRHTWMCYVPGLASSLDLPDIAALTAPGALLVQQCRRDTLYPMAGMQGAVDKLARIYGKAGIPDRFRGTFYDEPHSFRPAMQDEAFAWLARWL